MPLPDFQTYGELIYSLQARYPSVQRSTPHHKHIPPDIKHNRLPAPGIGFEQSNLPTLIEEIERGILSSPPST